MTRPVPATPRDGLAWITGASTGIGRALALLLAGTGWQVIATARSREGLASLAAACPGRIVAAPADVTDPASLGAALAAAVAQLGRPLALAVLNAGAWRQMGAADFDAAAFRAMMDVNLTGTGNALAAILPGMIARGGGQIALVASVAGYRGLPQAVGYGATKSGLISLAESLRFELRPLGVMVNVVNPGFVRTPMTAHNHFPMPLLLEPEDAAARIARGLAAGRFEVAFPAGLAWPLKLLRLLPAGLFFPLVAWATSGRVTASPKPPPTATPPAGS